MYLEQVNSKDTFFEWLSEYMSEYDVLKCYPDDDHEDEFIYELYIAGGYQLYVKFYTFNNSVHDY